jgi:hypothetical protein
MENLVENYRAHSKLTSPSTGTASLYGYEVPHGKIAILTFMSVIDYTHNENELMLGILDAGGNEHMLDFTLGTATDVKQTCKIEGKVILLSGEKPFGRVLSPTASDVIYVTAHGRLYSMEENEAA